MIGRLLAFAALLMLSGCAGRPDRPRSGAPVSKPFGAIADSRALRQCIGRLDRAVPRYALLRDRVFGGGCSATGAVQLRDIGTPVTNLGAMTCGLAEAFTQWIQNDIQGPARRYLGQRVLRVESMGTYACRKVIGAGSGKLSEHAHANAVDVGAFVLADGRRITIQGGWHDGDSAKFLRAIHASACRRFQTVLGPDYNAAHRNHLHLDMGRGPFCR